MHKRIAHDSPMDAQQLIDHHQLEPLPHEGGYFKRIYTHETCTAQETPLASAILFLITKQQFSALHRLPSDELFHFYSGHPAQMLQIAPNGTARWLALGEALDGTQSRTACVPAGHWQGMRLPEDAPDEAYAFFGVSVHPAFCWEGFELAQRESLCVEYPHLRQAITSLTRV